MKSPLSTLKEKDTGITHTFVEMPRIIKRDYLSCDQLLHTDNIFHFLPSIVFLNMSTELGLR